MLGLELRFIVSIRLRPMVGLLNRISAKVGV